MTDKLIDVKVRKRKVGKQCMHCKRPAKVTAVRKFRAGDTQMELNVQYCIEHAVALEVVPFGPKQPS